MDQVREVLRSHHYGYRTEQTYGQWIRRYIHHVGGKTHPNRLGAKDVERLLSHLATAGQVSASTQRQALNALVFLDRDVLRVQHPRLTPGVERHDEARLGPQIVHITQELIQRLADYGKEQLSHHADVRQAQPAELRGQRKDDMVMVTGEQAGLLERQPALDLEPRTWRT
jgi:hypothetical protein